jgi:hypothetical protein
MCLTVATLTEPALELEHNSPEYVHSNLDFPNVKEAKR